MKALHAHLAAQTAAPNGSHAPCVLVEIAGWGGTTVRWALSDAPVTFGGHVFNHRRFSLGPLQESHETSQAQASVSVANQDLAVTHLIGGASPVGCSVTFYRVFLDALDHAQSLLSGCEIAGYQLTEEAVTFSLVAGSAHAPSRFPARLAGRSCPWEFKGTECGYVGTDTTCDHSLEACRGRTGGDNSLHFGGIPPAVPGRA